MKKEKQEILKKKIALLSDNQISAIKADFIRSIKDDRRLTDAYIDGGFDNPLIKTLFFEYLEKRLLSGERDESDPLNPEPYRA